VVNFEKDFDLLEKEARDLNPLPPLAKLTDLLERWQREPVSSQEDIKRFAHELWVSLDDYEREMRDQVHGHQILLTMKEHKFMTHMEWLKNKFGFYLELYEQAFVELKLRQRKQVDQLQMMLADQESRVMNYQRDPNTLAYQIYGEIP